MAIYRTQLIEHIKEIGGLSSDERSSLLELLRTTPTTKCSKGRNRVSLIPKMKTLLSQMTPSVDFFDTDDEEGGRR